jgi:two-component system, LuxR family, response regulator FixJ
MADQIDSMTSKAVSASAVYIVDDDRDVRGSIGFLLKTVGMPSVPFASGVDFVDALDALAPGCILLDIRMPEMDGIEVLKELERREIEWPAVIMTGHGEIPLAVQSMKLGAVDFLEKPFDEELLIAALRNAQGKLVKRTSLAQRRREARTRMEQLTEREREVLNCLVEGLSNKLIAHRLGISLRTAEMHRAHMMTRLGVRSLAEACRIVADAEPSD